MKKLLNGKMIIGLLLVLLLFIEGCTLSSNTSTDEGSEKEPASQSTDVTNPSEGTEVEGYHEVKFALPAGMSEEAKEKTTLPVTTMIKDGSLIYSMKAPRQEGSVFLGWYYDDQLDLMVGPEDTVDYNMTLYPKFGLREDYEGEFSYDFIAEQDVSKKYPVLVTGHNLTAEEVKKFIRILDTGREGEVPFVVEPYGEEEEFKFEDLGLEEDQLENVRDMVSFKEGDPDYVLSEALNELGLDEETVDAILKEYAPDEWKQKSRSWMNDETKELMEAAGLSEEFSGVLDLAKQYGLEEGDSPARYWREELGFEPEEVLRMLEITEMLSEEAWNNTATYLIKPEDGAWIEGHSYDVEILDTASLRFFYNAEETIPKIIHHKFSVVKKEFNNIAMSNDIVYIPYADVQGIDSLGGLYGLVMDNEGNTTETSKRGVLTYTKGKLAPGMTVAVYDGTLNPDKSVDGSVGYFKIAEDQGNGKYRYGGADLTDVVFLPDVIPLPDDGTFDDGKFVIPAAALNFNTPLHRELKLGADTTVDVGDFVVFYTGAASKSSDLKNGQFAKITGVEKAAAGTEITYIPSTMDELHDSADMYMKVEQLDIPADEIDEQQIEAELLRQVEESNFISATGDYITGLILGEAKLPDDPNMAQGLKELTFATDKGEELSLEELRRLAGGASKVEISKPTVAFTISLSLKHFHGKGVRAVVTAGFTIKIAMNGDNKLEIVVAAAIEQEIQLGLDISVDTEWDVITLEEIYVDVALKAGTFTGFGGQATVMTKEDNPSEEKEWNALVGETGRNLNKSDTNSLLNLGDTVGKMATAISAIQEGGTVSKSGTDPAVQQYTDKYDGPQISSAGGDLPAKYSEMLDNDAEYVDLVKFELFNLAASPDPFHLIEFSLSASVKIGFKVNAMIGFSLSYGNGREFGYHIKCIEGSAKQSNDYYEKPNFRVDFFVFGMLGLRAGIELDARVGLISTKFDSIGITAEVGLYAELYGFLYMYYTWEADAGSDKGIMGSLLFEIGIYLEINFKAQVGDGKYEKEIELYSNTWPLLQLGAVEVPVPYQEDSDEDDEALSAMLEIPKGKSTVKVPDAVFGIDMMALSSGDVERRSQDSNKVGEKNYDFVINGRTFTQYNEQHFDVTCYDLDGKDGKVTKNHSFQYLPATNEIYVKPVDPSKDELWGIVTFTYRNESFGFSTMEIKRTLNVHWKGDPCSATVEYYVQGANGYELVKEGSFDGFDGIEYDILVNDAFVYQFPGYRLAEVVFPDSDKQWDVVQKAYDEMSKLYAVYQKTFTKKDEKAWWSAHQHWNTLWNKANMYDWNIEETIRNKKGTLYFLMVKNVTTVRLYFASTSRYVSAELLYEDMPNAARTNAGTYMKMGDNMYDKLKPGIDHFLEENVAYQIKSDYYVYFTDDKFMTVTEALAKKSEWQVLTKDTIMPDREAFIFTYINSDKPFTLTWIDRGEIVRQDQLIRWQDIPAPPETKPYPGYTHTYYSWTKDTGENLVTNARMEDRDVTYTLRWTPQNQTITWNVDGETWTTTAKTDDLVVAQWPGTYRGSDWKRWGGTLEKEGYTLTWKVKAGDAEGDFNPAMKTPAGGVTLIAVYTLNSYKAVWKDGDSVVKEETLDFGSPLQAPDVAVPEGTGMRWQLDGKDLAANATMPGRDVTISTSRHTHDWKEDRVLREMNCNTVGRIRYKCAVCGETKEEDVPIDPEAHNWNRTSFSLAYCKRPQVDHYTCKNCGQKKDVEVGDVDPSRHISGSWTLPGIPATCGLEGRYTATYCNDCDALLSGGGVIPATGNHSWSGVANPDATCTETGTMHFTCNVCSATKEETIPAKGHSWRNPTYSWSDDHLTATASRTCDNDSSHVETETVLTTNEVIYEATCTSVGQRNYYAVFTNTAFTAQSYGELIPKIPHIWNAPIYTWADDLSTVTAKRVCQYDPNEHHVETETATVKSAVTTAPGCETTGIRTYTANFSNAAFATQVKDVVVPAAGHTWGEPTYSWSDNNAFVTATRVCTVDANHTESETVETTASFTISPQCETPGSLMYTAAFTNQAFQTQTKTVSASPTDHSWGEPVYVWATDYSTVTAERVCQNDGSHKETEIAVTSSEITKAPTYDEMGETTYTVTFTNTAFGVQTQTVTNVPKTPEEYDAPTYVWAADYSSVTASRVRKDGKKTESETASATGEVTTPATCLAMGKTTYTSAAFTNPAFEVQTKVVETIAALSHQWGAVTYTWADDYSTVTAGRVCAHDASHVETETAITSSAVTKPATFDEMGETTYTATFTNTAFETQTRTVTNIEKVPEGWNAPTYEWALDYSTVTATRVRTDGLKTETETVAASGEVTTPATCESKGITTYTSQSFTNTAFTVQTKVVDNIPALNHNWGGVSYVWADDYLSVTASRVCLNDSSHTETETVSASGEVTTPATCEAKGTTTYTSSAFTNAAFEVQTASVDNVPALNHSWGAVTYTWADDLITVTATRVCAHDAAHIETETVSTTSSVATPATCEVKGISQYTSAAFTNPAFSVQQKVADDIPATGHEWGTVTYTWADDHSTVTATRVCAHDGAHVQTEQVAATMTVITAATCQSEGSASYTASFTNTAFEAQTVNVTLPVNPDGHVYETIVRSSYASAPELEGSYSLVPGMTVKVCTLCGVETVAEKVKVEPKLDDNQLSFYDWLDESLRDPAAGKTLQDVMDKLDEILTVVVTLPTNPNGTGYYWGMLFAELTWAENYSSVLLSDIDTMLQNDPDLHYQVKVHIKPTYQVYDGHVYEGYIGRSLVGSLDNLQEVTVDVDLVGHNHDWVESDVVKHTDTEDGYIEYECSTCHTTRRDIIPAGHDWILKEDVDEGEEELKGSYVVPNETGAYEDIYGNHYDLHIGPSRFYCSMCGTIKVDDAPKYTPGSGWGFAGVFNKDLVGLGYETVWEIPVGDYMEAYCDFYTEDGDYVMLVVPGTFKWAVGQQSMLKGTTIESLQDHAAYSFAADVEFIPDDPDIFTNCILTFVIDNYYSRSNHYSHQDEATYTLQTDTEPYWDPELDGKGGWFGGRVYAVCDYCGEKKLDHYIHLAAYVENYLDGTITAGVPEVGTSATINVSTSKLIEWIGDLSVGEMVAYNDNITWKKPWVNLFRVFYSDDGTPSGTHSETLTNGAYSGFVRITTDVSTLPSDTKLSELTEPITVVYDFNVNKNTFSPVTITLVIEP